MAMPPSPSVDIRYQAGNMRWNAGQSVSTITTAPPTISDPAMIFLNLSVT
jgi:hypothetical protein